MIPKFIHYIWLGGQPLTELAERCISSWQKYCPDYEIIRWDESNFDININKYCQEAYQLKKWAFSSDYIRLWVLVNMGGFYLDTDVEIIRSLDNELVDRKCLFGFESHDRISTAFMACEPNYPLMKEMLESYSDDSFICENGSLNQTTNVKRITSILASKGVQLTGRMQEMDGALICPPDYFSPKVWYTGMLSLSDNNYDIHHFDGSWASGTTKVKNLLIQLLGENFTSKIKKLIG